MNQDTRTCDTDIARGLFVPSASTNPFWLLSSIMNRNLTQGCAILIGAVIGAYVTFVLTKTTAAKRQIDVFTAGVYFGCRNAPKGTSVTDRKRCLILTGDARQMARKEAYFKSPPVRSGL